MKSALISKKNFIASLSITNIFLKTKRKYHGDEITDFFVKKIPRIGSDGNCLAVISLDFALKR